MDIFTEDTAIVAANNIYELTDTGIADFRDDFNALASKGLINKSLFLEIFEQHAGIPYNLEEDYYGIKDTLESLNKPDNSPSPD